MIVYFFFILAVAPVHAMHTCGVIVPGEPLAPFQDPDPNRPYTYTHSPDKWEMIPNLQTTPGGHYKLGSYAKTELTGIDTKHHYTGGDGARSSTVSFQCAPGSSADMVVDVQELPALHYKITIGSAACCPPLPPPSPPPRLCGSFANTGPLKFTPQGVSWVYIVQPYQTAERTSSDGGIVSLGTYSKTEDSGSGIAHYYTNGDACWLGQVQTILSFECDYDASVEEIISAVVTEYACTHTLTIRSAACCAATPMPSLHPTRAPSLYPTPMPSLYPTRAPTTPLSASCDRDPWSFKGLRVNSDLYGLFIILGESVKSHDGINYGDTVSSGQAIQNYIGGDVHYTCASLDGAFYGHRSSVIQFHCGLDREVVHVAEGLACQKVIKLNMPGCCTTSEWNELHANRQTTTSVSTLTATGGASPVDIDTDVDGSTSTTHVDTDMGVTTTTSNTDVELPIAVNVTSSPDVTVSIDTTSPTDLSLPVDSTSSTDVSLPIDITSAPHITLNLHLDNKEDRDDGLDSSSNAAAVVILIVMSMFCILLVGGIVYSATAQNIADRNSKHDPVEKDSKNQHARFEL